MNMKRRVLLCTVVVMAAWFASCDSKLCYCYQTTSSGVYEEEVYTSTDNHCNVLSTSSRTCVEQNERMPDGGAGIAYLPAPALK